MQVKIDPYRILLLRAAVLYERHEAGRDDPFNVFSVLRSANDEVNLHSRFLHALLDHRKSQDSPRENLKDFLCCIYKDEQAPNVCPDTATVERERGNVDILIRDTESKHSLVIENKIWAEDQPRQLQNYAEGQEGHGFDPHLLYLTPYGREASEESAGGLCYKRISYKKHIREWLVSCQKRAYDEPSLRESIVQYRRSIGKLTGTDLSEVYMDELSNLCMEGENLVLVHDLNRAMTKARISLLEKLWNEIESKIKETTDLPDNGEPSDISQGRIRRFVTLSRNYKWHGLYYPFSSGAKLGIEVDHHIFFGISCWREGHQVEFDKIKNRLDGFEGGDNNEKWPWLCWNPTDPNPNLRQPNREHLELLANEETRAKYVEELVNGVDRLWREIKCKGLVNWSA